MIRFEHVTKIYPTKTGAVRALDDVDLRVEAGEFVAVRGASGSGKSTLLMIAGGLSRPSGGRAVVAGLDLRAASPGELARFRAEQIGFVFQMFHLLPYLTVLDNVVAAAGARQRREARHRAGQLLERFQLGHRLSHRPAELSAGERQRVAMARALINHPRLVLADEPTGNLDPASAEAVLGLLSDFHRQGGTVLLATHHAEAAAAAQRTVQLVEGHLDSGDHA